MKQLGGRIRLIVDGGQSQVGIESTVIDLTTPKPKVLRPGMIHEESLLAVLPEIQGRGGSQAGIPDGILKSPGQLARHYSPHAKLVLLSWENETDLKSKLKSRGLETLQIHVISHTQIPSGLGSSQVSVIPHDAEAFARAIYAELHRCDELGAELIVVESPPGTKEWEAIIDRLKRASS
jgi:L-threonylcarbamoyladenylate synthase